jgi:ATP-dependent Clp protease protease subunit
VQGTAADISIQAEEILRLKQELNQIFATHTGQEIAKVEKDADRDFFMSAREAKEYGLVDEVVEPTVRVRGE